MFEVCDASCVHSCKVWEVLRAGPGHTFHWLGPSHMAATWEPCWLQGQLGQDSRSKSSGKRGMRYWQAVGNWRLTVIPSYNI